MLLTAVVVFVILLRSSGSSVNRTAENCNLLVVLIMLLHSTRNVDHTVAQ